MKIRDYFTLLFTLISLGSCTTFHSENSRDLLPNSNLSQKDSLIRTTPLSAKKITLDNEKQDMIEDENLDYPNLLSEKNSETVDNQEKEKLTQQFYFDWPVDDARLTRGFLPKKKRPHLGLDLAAPKGTPIYSSHKGMVIYTGREFRGYGKMILVESGDGWATLYAHLDKILVTEGQIIRQGQVIAAMGRTGRATGVHLHFEVRKNLSPVDPLPLMPMGQKAATYDDSSLLAKD